MADIFKKPYDVKLPARKNDEQEFGGGKKGIIVCPECNNAFFEEKWRHDFKGLPALRNKKNIPITFKLCPADEMIKNHQFEGEIRLQNVPAKHKEELENLIIAYGKRAYDRDPMDRIIEIKKRNENWVVTTTENQLANKLARKIRSSFRKVKSTVTKFTPEPSDVARVVVQFEE